MPYRSLALMALLLASLCLAIAGHAQAGQPVKTYDLYPNLVQPGATVGIQIQTALNTALIATSATLDLSPIGLSAASPTERSLDLFTSSFTVPPGTAAGDYSVKATIMAGGTVFATPVATLHVTNGPLLKSALFDPTGLQPGMSSTLTAVIAPGDAAVASVVADLSAFGLSATAPLANPAANTYSLTVDIPATALEQILPATVKMTDAQGRTSSLSAGLDVRFWYSDLGCLTVTPPYARPNGVVSMKARFGEQYCPTLSATVDLTPFGLSSEYPLVGDFEDRAATFTIPPSQPDGLYTILMTWRCGSGTAQTAAASLRVTRGPIITKAEYEDNTVMSGELATITATVDPGDATSFNVTADLTTFGLSATVPLTNFASPAKYYRTFVAHDPNKVYGATVVTVTDTQGRTCTASDYLTAGWVSWPHLMALTASPQPVRPGQVQTITIAPNGFPVFSAYADLSAFGFPYYQNIGAFPLRPLTFTVPANTPPGPYRVVAWIGDEGSEVQSEPLILTVGQPVLHGDVNGDGTFNLPDVLAALRIAGGLAKSTDLALLAASTPGSQLSRLSIADAVRLARDLRTKSAQ